MSLVVLSSRQALAVNDLLDELDDDTFPADVDSAIISMTAQLGGVDASALSMDIRLFWLQLEKAVKAEGQGEPVTRNMIEFLFDKACKSFSLNLKTEYELAGFIARNPDVLHHSFSGGPNSAIIDQARGGLIESYLKTTQSHRKDEFFIRQFPAGFSPVSNYRQVALEMVAWLEANAVELADGYSPESLRGGIEHIKDGDNELLYFFYEMALGNPESNPVYEIFAKRILIAEQALQLKEMFGEPQEDVVSDDQSDAVEHE